MSKKRFNEQQSAPPARQREPQVKRPTSGLPWHPVWRWLVSLLVIMHLAAIISAPWSLATGDALPPGYRAPAGQPEVPGPNSTAWQQPLVPRTLHRFFHHYLNLIYMNHGYEFFAPDPSGTHLISYRVAQPDGSTVEGRFPDLESQWPRLFYHRHMMLAEQTQMMGRTSGQSYANHLATLYGGPSRIDWIIHMLLSPQQVKEGRPLDDRSTYQVLESLEGRPRRRSSSEGPVAIPGGNQ